MTFSEPYAIFYILEGRLSYLGSDPPIILEPGDYIAHHRIPERSWFKAETNVIVLSMSSPPSFHVYREEAREFFELARLKQREAFLRISGEILSLRPRSPTDSKRHRNYNHPAYPLPAGGARPL